MEEYQVGVAYFYLVATFETVQRWKLCLASASGYVSKNVASGG